MADVKREHRRATITPIIGEQLDLLPGETIATRSGSATVTRTETAGLEQIIWADYGSGIEQPHISEGIQPKLKDYPQIGIGDRIEISWQGWPKVDDTCTVLAISQANADANTSPTLMQVQDDSGLKFCLSLKKPDLIRLAGSSSEQSLSPEQLSQSNPARSRRYSPKGQACGWIEERQGNLSRKRPSRSYYYCWQDGETRSKRYIPARQRAAVRQLVGDRAPVAVVLETLAQTTRKIPQL